VQARHAATHRLLTIANFNLHLPMCAVALKPILHVFQLAMGRLSTISGLYGIVTLVAYGYLICYFVESGELGGR
jgi:hypothetical protein